MKDFFLSKAYWYEVWKNVLRPPLFKYVKDSEPTWDDSAFEVVDRFMDVLLKPQDPQQ